jgi:hypothetical protein
MDTNQAARDFRTSLAVAVPTAGALLALHRRLWRKDPLWDKPHGRVYAYLLGCGTLWAGFAAWCLHTGDRPALRAYTLLLALSGATVLGAWVERWAAARWQDWVLYLHAGRLARAARQAGGPL